MTENQAINTVIQIATNEIGYLEKRSNANLDDKTANAGSNNYTKYWRDVCPSLQAQPWCACFVSWVFMKAFGQANAKTLLKHWPYTYCPTLAGMTTNKTPKTGSIIIFNRNGTYTHTGIVIGVNGSTVTTIEGNTSGSSGIVANGGGVFKKQYSTGNLSAATKYFVPNYSILSGVSSSASDSAPTNNQSQQTSGRSWLQLGDKGEAVKEMQQMLIKAGYSCGSYGADGHYGQSTYNAVVKFQREHGLAVDGEYGEASKAALKALLNKQAQAQPSQTASSGVALNTSVKCSGIVKHQVKVRRYAGKNYDVCSFSPLKMGETVGICDTIKGTDGEDWHYVLYNGKYGFVLARYIQKL